VAKSETEHRHRDAALAHLVASYGNMNHPVDTVLDQYTALCAIAMNCRGLARAAAFLARHGLRADGSRLLSCSDAKRLNAAEPAPRGGRAGSAAPERWRRPTADLAGVAAADASHAARAAVRQRGA
jgi:hypothetical protein